MSVLQVTRVRPFARHTEANDAHERSKPVEMQTARNRTLTGTALPPAETGARPSLSVLMSRSRRLGIAFYKILKVTGSSGCRVIVLFSVLNVEMKILWKVRV
jgi:hypothetical protein